MFQLKDVLQAIGPTASIVFAAWIFMGFLQQRYDSASERYKATVDQYRDKSLPKERRANLKDQALRYRRRCLLMLRATRAGLLAAMLLISALVVRVADVVFPRYPALAVAGTALAAFGFLLVILSAAIVYGESLVVGRQTDAELLDVPDVAQAIGSIRGAIQDRGNKRSPAHLG